MNVAIDGPGYFRVVDDITLETLYTRSGRLTLNPDHVLCIECEGRKFQIDPTIWFPTDAVAPTFTRDGFIAVECGEILTTIGELQLSTFDLPPAFIDPWKIGRPTSADAVERTHQPGRGAGTLQQGWLEFPPPGKAEIFRAITMAIFASLTLHLFTLYLNQRTRLGSASRRNPSAVTSHL